MAGGRPGPADRGRLRRLRAVAGARPGLVAGLLLVGLALALVYPAVTGGRVLGPEDLLLFNAPLSSVRPAGLLAPSNALLTDAVQVFHPDLEWARGVLRSGHLPLWSPEVFGGWPVLASQQTAMLYPLNLIAYVLPFWPALGIIAVLKVLLAAAGTWWLCRRLGLGAAAALLAAVTYGLGSYFVIWLEHPHTNVYALIPWLLGAVDLVCARRRLADAGVLGAVVALCLLGGHPESTFIAGLAAAAFAALCLTGGAAGRGRGLLLLLGGVVLGLAGGAVMVVPFAELAGQAPRLGRGGGGGAPDQALLSVFLPDLWGRPDGGFAATGPVNYAERTFYVGALPLMLAVGGLAGLRTRQHRFFAGLALGAAVLAVHVPVLTQAIAGLPGFSLVDLGRALILVVLCLAVLAGYGLEELRAGSPGQRRVFLALAGAVAWLPIGWLVLHGAALRAFPRFSDLAPSLGGASSSLAQTGAAAATRWVVFALAGLGVLLLLGRRQGLGRRRSTSVGLALAVGLAAVDLLALNRGYNPAITQARAQPAPTPSLVRARALQGSGRTAAFSEYLIPNVASRYGLRDPRGHGLPALARYLALWNGLGGAGFQATRVDPRDRRTAALLDDFAVSVALTTTTGLVPHPSGLRLVTRLPDGAVYRNLDALPRAYLASSWRPAATRGSALTQTVASTAARLRTAPVIEGAAAGSGRGAASVGGTARFTEDGADEVALEVDAPRSGYLVLLDNYYPGWRATVDGRDAPIHPANEAFRAVAVASGRHQVVFRYRPPAVIAAAVVSLAAWLAILLLIALPRLRRRRWPGSPPRPQPGRAPG